MNLRKIRVHAHGSSNRLGLSQGKFQTIHLNNLDKTNRAVNKNDFESSCDVSSSNFRIQMSKSCNGSFKVNKQPKTTFIQNSPFKNSIQMTQRVAQQHFKSVAYKQKKQNDRNGNSLAKIQNKIKSIFAGKSNVKRIVKAWNFIENKNLELPEFHNILQNKLAINIEREQAAKLMNKYSERKDGTIESHQLLKLIYGQHQNITFKPFTTQYCKFDELKSQRFLNSVKNLSLNSTFYQNSYNKAVKEQNDKQVNVQSSNGTMHSSKLNMSQMAKKSKRIRTSQDNPFQEVTNSIGFNYEESSSVLCNLIGKRKILKNQTLHPKKLSSQFQPEHLSLSMTNSNSWKTKTEFTTKVLQSQTNPKLLFGIGQRKTRLGATPHYNTKREFSEENCHESYKNSKQKVDRQLIAQREREKSKYANKLRIIRENRQNQTEKIDRLNKKLDGIELANLNKKKLERQAYNYVAFINNQWR